MNTKKASCIPTIAIIETNMWIKKIIMTEICLASDHIHQKFHFSKPFDKWLYPSICFLMRSLVLGMIGMFQWNVFVLFLND